MRARGATLALLGLLVVSASASGGSDPAPDLREGGSAERFERAAALKKQDVRALGAALTALGRSGPPREGDVEFLVEVVAQEPSRVLRLLATESLADLAAGEAAPHLLDRAARERDGARAAALVEAAGQVGAAAHAARLVPLLEHESNLVALAAARALARLGTQDQAEALADHALGHPWPVAAEHIAWALLDVTRSRAKAERLLASRCPKGDAARAERLAVLLAALAEAKTPHRWSTPFAAARKALATQGAPRVAALNPAMQGWIGDSLRWMQTNAPADLWVLCATVRAIETADAPTRLDAQGARVVLSHEDCGLPPAKLACLLFRCASVLLRERSGEPSEGRRGWDGAVAESWDLCAAAKIHEAGRRGVSREDFLERGIALRPRRDE